MPRVMTDRQVRLLLGLLAVHALGALGLAAAFLLMDWFNSNEPSNGLGMVLNFIGIGLVVVHSLLRHLNQQMASLVEQNQRLREEVVASREKRENRASVAS